MKRAGPPAKGLWALPGGLVEVGESVEGAAKREVADETGLGVEIGELIDVQTDIHLDRRGEVEYHYILVDYLARPVSGRVRLNEESSDFGWFTAAEARRMKTTSATKALLGRRFGERSR